MMSRRVTVVYRIIEKFKVTIVFLVQHKECSEKNLQALRVKCAKYEQCNHYDFPWSRYKEYI